MDGHLKWKNPVTGQIESLAADPCVCYWRPELHLPAFVPVKQHYTDTDYPDQSIMGTNLGNYWQDHGDSTFTRQGLPYHAPAGLSALDLYAMGLLAPEEVPDTFLLTNIVDLGNGRVRATKVWCVDAPNLIRGRHGDQEHVTHLQRVGRRKPVCQDDGFHGNAEPPRDPPERIAGLNGVPFNLCHRQRARMGNQEAQATPEVFRVYPSVRRDHGFNGDSISLRDGPHRFAGSDHMYEHQADPLERSFPILW